MNTSLENFKDITVLYVEDETGIRSSVEHCLNYIFNVISAEDGQEGLEKFQSEKIDLIITDINMPVKDGLVMLEAIRKVSPNTPFIVTSAYDSEHLNKMEELDVFKYIAKPFDMKELVMHTINALK